MQSHFFQVPDSLLDPISYDLICDPVVAEDNKTYSRESISKWLNQPSKNRTYAISPMTGLPMGCHLIPNTKLNDAINRWSDHTSHIDELKAIIQDSIKEISVTPSLVSEKTCNIMLF